MKKIAVLVVLLLTAFTFQCSEPSNELTRNGMSPGLKEEVEEVSKRLQLVWVSHWRLNSRKSLVRERSISSMLDEAKAALDPQRQAYFDAALRYPEMKKLITWTKVQLQMATSGGPLKGAGRTTDVWDIGTTVSREALAKMDQLHASVDNTLAGMEGSTTDQIANALNSVIHAFETGVYQSTTLTQADKDALGSSATTLYNSLDAIVTEYFGDPEPDPIPENQDKIQGWWSTLKNKVGSVILTMAVCALAAAVVGAIIVATGGAAALALPTTVSLFGWEVGFIAVTSFIGASAGLAFGTGMALSNQCLSSAGDTIGYVSCQD